MTQADWHSVCVTGSGAWKLVLEISFVWQSCCRLCHGIFKAPVTLQVLHHTCLKGESDHFIISSGQVWTAGIFCSKAPFLSCALWPFTEEFAMTSLASVELSAPLGTLIQCQQLMAQMPSLNSWKEKQQHFLTNPSYSNRMSHQLRIGLHLLFLILFLAVWPWKAMMKRKPSRPLPGVCFSSLPQSCTFQLPPARLLAVAM